MSCSGLHIMHSYRYLYTRAYTTHTYCIHITHKQIHRDSLSLSFFFSVAVSFSMPLCLLSSLFPLPSLPSLLFSLSLSFSLQFSVFIINIYWPNHLTCDLGWVLTSFFPSLPTYYLSNSTSEMLPKLSLSCSFLFLHFTVWPSHPVLTETLLQMPNANPSKNCSLTGWFILRMALE